MAGLQKFRALIGGQWVESAGGEWFESFNPYTGQPWALIPRCGRADAHLAVEAARSAFAEGPWRQYTPTARGALLRKLGDLIARDADALAQIETRDNGKLIVEMRGQL